MKLKFMKAVAGKQLKVEDLRAGTTSVLPVDQNGAVTFNIAKPADFLLLRYQVIQ